MDRKNFKWRGRNLSSPSSTLVTLLYRTMSYLSNKDDLSRVTWLIPFSSTTRTTVVLCCRASIVHISRIPFSLSEIPISCAYKKCVQWASGPAIDLAVSKEESQTHVQSTPFDRAGLPMSLWEGELVQCLKDATGVFGAFVVALKPNMHRTRDT